MRNRKLSYGDRHLERLEAALLDFEEAFSQGRFLGTRKVGIVCIVFVKTPRSLVERTNKQTRIKREFKG